MEVLEGRLYEMGESSVNWGKDTAHTNLAIYLEAIAQTDQRGGWEVNCIAHWTPDGGQLQRARRAPRMHNVGAESMATGMGIR